MRAVGNHVIVEEEEPPTVSAGGVILPENARAGESLLRNKGKVLSVGLQCRELKVDDVVMYSKYEGQEQTDENGKTVVVLRENEVACKVLGD